MSALRHQGPGSKAAALNFTIKLTYKINGVGRHTIVAAEAKKALCAINQLLSSRSLNARSAEVSGSIPLGATKTSPSSGSAGFFVLDNV